MTSVMRQEILASSKLLEAQLSHNLTLWQKFANLLKVKVPHTVMTVARGSSDHASIYGKYLFETELLLPTCSSAPSVISIYKAALKIDDVLVLGLSQSGQSPDILEVVRYARTRDALTLALVNDVHSPLAQAAEYVIPLHAGPELSVAATKSFLLTLTALIQGVAIIKDDAALLTALAELPKLLDQVFQMDVAPYLSYFDDTSALVLGRGFGFSIAEELALKFKEVTQIHAEAFSSAEVLHGPFTLMQAKLPVLALAQNDACLPSLIDTLTKIRAADIEPLVICSEENQAYFQNYKHKVLLPKTHALLTPVLACAFVYLLIETLAQKRGLNPDEPPLIQKVTRTR